jgi:hypothetical protein
MLKDIILLTCFFCVDAALYSSDDDNCQQLIAVITEEENRDEIKSLYDFKLRTYGKWYEHFTTGEGISSQLVMTDSTPVNFRWTITDLDSNESYGENLDCEIPRRWNLLINKPTTIAYPPAGHGHQEESATYQIKTIGGIYFATSKDSFFPHIMSFFWYLNQKDVSQNQRAEIMSRYPFLTSENTIVEINGLDENDNIQLIALQTSPNMEIFSGEQKWLITGFQTHQLIREKTYASSKSQHDAWLPWLNKQLPEFSMKTPQEVYQNTIVAPIGLGKIFDAQQQQFIKDPISAIDNVQVIVNTLASPLDGFLSGDNNLFIHLLFKAENNFILSTFEMSLDGNLILRFSKTIKDPSDIHLLPARDLGF